MHAAPSQMCTDDALAVAASVRAQAKVAAQALFDKTHRRLPDCAFVEATRFVYPEFLSLPVASTTREPGAALTALDDGFVAPVDVGWVSPLPPKPLDVSALELQWDTFSEAASSASKRIMAMTDKDVESSGMSRLTLLWQSLHENGTMRDLCSEWFVLAEISIVLVAGSVEDERRFSNLKWLKNELRNHLGEEHCELVVRMFVQYAYNMKTFPYESVLASWVAAKSRRGVGS